MYQQVPFSGCLCLPASVLSIRFRCIIWGFRCRQIHLTGVRSIRRVWHVSNMTGEWNASSFCLSFAAQPQTRVFVRHSRSKECVHSDTYIYDRCQNVTCVKKFTCEVGIFHRVSSISESETSSVGTETFDSVGQSEEISCGFGHLLSVEEHVTVRTDWLGPFRLSFFNILLGFFVFRFFALNIYNIKLTRINLFMCIKWVKFTSSLSHTAEWLYKKNDRWLGISSFPETLMSTGYQ